jgi:hypothetical protein
MPASRLLASCALAAASLAAPLHAQHAGHDMAGMNMDSTPVFAAHVMAQAIPLFTRLIPASGPEGQSQGALTQTLVMGRVAWWRGHAQFDGALNGEGLVMRNGELNMGAWGEGFVDRRHPHAYVHELMLSGVGSTGPVAYSASAGRGFVPFGSDDPMMRPMVKYPLNHHLSQILERALVIGAARVGPAILEGSTFAGDEPVSPSSAPTLSRLGDSWSVRGTIVPVPGTEVQASYARVASPEEPGGFGLDQRKRSVSARGISPDGSRYLLAEWARTVDRDHSRDLDVFAYESALVEGSIWLGKAGIAARLEQTERPEEDRLADPTRTPRPGADLSINGITQWRVATVQFSAPAMTRGSFSGFPFVEVARLTARPREPNALLTPDRLYGTSRFWMLTAGLRLRLGAPHARMGRYGVAITDGPSIATQVGGARAAHVH